MRPLFLALLDMSVAAGIAACAVVAVRLLLKRAPRVYSYALWAVVWFRLLCPFSLEGALGILPANAAAAAQGVLTARQAPLVPVNPGPAAPAHIAPALVPPASPAADPLDLALGAAAWVWLAGALLLLGYALFHYLRLKTRLRGAVLVRENIYETDRIVTPFVLGFFRPEIYLPVGLENAGDILRHEQTHIRRLDHLARPVAFFALCLHWFNPLVWLSYSLFCKDMELSCDEQVLRSAPGDIRARYSNSLLAMSVHQSGLLSPLAFGEGNTKTRVKNVLRYHRPTVWISAVALVAVLAVTIGFAMTRAPKASPAERAVQQLADSVAYQEGELRFQIPSDYPEPGDWNIHIAGRAAFDDGFTASVHELDAVNEARGWEAGAWYSIPVQGRGLTELTMDISLPDADRTPVTRTIDLLAALPDGAGDQGSGFLYAHAGLTVTLPDDYRDRVTITPADRLAENTVLEVYQTVSFERDPGGAGFLFRIVRHTPAAFEDYWPVGDRVGGYHHFATDDAYYYSVETPTDVQWAYPSAREEYQRLSDQLGAVLASFLLENNLSPYDHNAAVYAPAYTYPGEHAVLHVTLSNGAQFRVVLSRPIRQGDGGIWCVERMYDEHENLYIAVPETDLTAMEHYEQQQAQADAGRGADLLDAEAVALAYLDTVWDFARHISDASLDYLAGDSMGG